MNQEKLNEIYRSISDLGDFFPLRCHLDQDYINNFLKRHNNKFQVYNPLKPDYKRYGLSLTSLDGELNGIDLTSIKEHNRVNKTNYNEMSFRTNTEVFNDLIAGSSDLESLGHLLGRSHIIKLSLGGFFPPHRDMGNSIRLISFLNSSYHDTFLMQEGQRINWHPYKLYYFNTKKEHSIFNFSHNSDFIIFNLELSEKTQKWILDRLGAQ